VVCVELFLALVLTAAVSLRGAGRAIAVSARVLGLALACPSWSAGRLGLLRLGYYTLRVTRPKEFAEDWVWIIDHTVQVGQDKCVVILGIRLGDLPPVGQCVSHADVEPIERVPVQQSNGDIVYQQLEQALAKTGVPRAIVSDHGTDLKAGIAKFCQDHPETSPIYDIKHKTAAVLKQELERDPGWLTFTQLANQTGRRVQQTDLAALTPPNQKTQARYMNLDELVRWGHAMLALLDQPEAHVAQAWGSQPVHEKLGWLKDFRSQLAEWGELLEIITTAESFVRQHGLYPNAHRKLESQLRGRAQTARTRRVRRELVAFVAAQETQAREGERLLGSSEIIESVLGSLKRLEQDQAKSGFTGLILGLGAMVATTTQDIIQRALETVPTKTVLAWCRETLGRSVQAKRREIFERLDLAEQKQDPFLEGT